MLQQSPHIGTCQELAPLWGTSNITVLRQQEAERHFESYRRIEWVSESVTPWGTFEWSGERMVVSLTREIDGCLKRLQFKGVRLNKIEEIREYLLQFPDMIEATEEIASVSLATLSGIQLTLEVYQDPEIDDKHLVLYARYKNYDQDMMEKIRDVRKKSRKYLLGKSGWLHLTTDFQPVE